MAERARGAATLEMPTVRLKGSFEFLRDSKLELYVENPMDRGAWRATVHWVTKSDMSEMT